MTSPSKNLEDFPDRIAESFANKTLLITGGTGFLGKVLIEKLLRSCTDLKKIYMLVSTKKNKNPKERIKSILNGPLFDKVKKEKGSDVLKKVEVVSADISQPDLALDPEDRKKLVEEVEIIYHSAASVRFDEELKKGVLLNVRGTKLLLNLAKECKHLMFFCHISTAYCHIEQKVLEEKAYPPPACPHHVINTCEWLDDKVLQSISKKILANTPNCYTFTKALSEALVADEMDNIPAVVTRPSVVVPIWKEPLPGWTDNFNGPAGLLIGAGKGVIRTMYGRRDIRVDYVPVDLVVNALICIFFTFQKSKRRFYNFTSPEDNKITTQQVIDMGLDVATKKLPLSGELWYPGGSLKTSRIHHLFDFYLFQWLPAVFIDALLILIGFKPVLMKAQRKIWKGYEMFEYYVNNEWVFKNDGIFEDVKMLNPREQAIYKLNAEGMDYYEYFTDCIHAARLYLLKENDDTIPAAKRHMRILWFLDRICKLLIIMCFLYFIYGYFIAPIFGM